MHELTLKHTAFTFKKWNCTNNVRLLKTSNMPTKDAQKEKWKSTYDCICFRILT